jgi:hypothetical protein
MTHTYWHFGRKAATTIAPEAPRVFPLRSAEVMEVSIVAGWYNKLPIESLISVLHAVKPSEHRYAVGVNW